MAISSELQTLAEITCSIFKAANGAFCYPGDDPNKER